MIDPLHSPKVTQIEADERDHIHLYELRPMSRWWLVLVLALNALSIYNVGFSNWQSWALLLNGVMLGFALILTNPKRWLSRLD